MELTNQSASLKAASAVEGLMPDFDLSHLVPAVQAIALMDAATRIERIRGDWVVRHAAVKHILNHARWLIESPKGVRTEGLLITGANGAGKSTIASLIRRHYTDPDSRAVPVVNINMSGARHMRTVYGRVIEALQGPVKASHHTPDREMTVLRLLKAVGARVLVVDEIQDLVAESRPEQCHTLKALKFIMEEVKIPVVALGTEPAEKAFATDDHMASRFERLTLPPWGEGEELAALLTGVSRILPLRRPSMLHEEVFVREILAITKGSMKAMMRLLRIAAVNAIISGDERIDVSKLKDAMFVPNMDELDDFLIEEVTV